MGRLWVFEGKGKTKSERVRDSVGDEMGVRFFISLFWNFNSQR